MSSIPVSTYPQLLNTLITSPRIVYLCGAGASMSLGEHGLSWPRWILAGKDYLSSAEQDVLESKVGNWTTDELIDAATWLLDRTKSAGAYKAFMEQTIGALHPVNHNFMEALQRIWRMGDLITTTNYDTQIEESVGASGITYKTPVEILSILRGESENKVIHLHGMYDEKSGIDDIIADDPQYRDILANGGAQFIQNLISTYPIMIVGCGGTVEDPNLAGFMSFAVEQLKVTGLPYFYLMRKGDEVPALPPNAVIIFYGDDYADLPSFLAELSLVRLQKRISLRSVISVNPYQDHRVASSAFGRMYFANEFNPFTGRNSELCALNEFLSSGSKISWWGILGEGGIGKSRLIMEWMKQLPFGWFGFFARKHANQILGFQPFTDTVVAFDYVLGQETDCAESIAAYLGIFENSPYQLRIILIERHRSSSDYDWLIQLKRALPSDFRCDFEADEYGKPFLLLESLSESEQVRYTEHYLTTYLPLLSENDFIANCLRDIGTTAGQIVSCYRSSIFLSCDRPLYLSIFIEVWISKGGHADFHSVEDLLSEYLNKEKKRWKILLGTDTMVDSYLRVLAVACAIGHFNLTDMYGENYLEDDCKKLIAFFDRQSRRPGADNLFVDLFVAMDELTDDVDDPVLELLHDPETSTSIEPETVKTFRTLEADERYAYMAAYMKISADPEEVYLRMLVSAGIATADEQKKLDDLITKKTLHEASLPPTAWLIDPVFPDIIKEYIVSYAVNERDLDRFTKLARANSVLGLSAFLSRALEDWPANKKLQKIAVTPPGEVLNYFEYYVGLLGNVRNVDDLKTVEHVLLSSEPLFQRYELELWKRIAVVLTERGNIDRLFESGQHFITYLKDRIGKVSLRNEWIEVMDAYCVGLHNAEAVEKFGSLLEQCCDVEKMLPENLEVGEFCCEKYGLLLHLKYYENSNADLRPEWEKIEFFLNKYGNPETMCRTATKYADDYIHSLICGKDSRSLLLKLKQVSDTIGRRYNMCKAIETAALCIANIFAGQTGTSHENDLEMYECLKQYLELFPESKVIRMSLIRTSDIIYSQTSGYRRVPDRLLAQAKNWSAKYPDEIEFQEAYFGLLLSRLQFAQAQDKRNEQRRIFREMKDVAEKADYSVYRERNQMMETVRLLERLYGY